MVIGRVEMNLAEKERPELIELKVKRDEPITVLVRRGENDVLTYSLFGA